MKLTSDSVNELAEKVQSIELDSGKSEEIGFRLKLQQLIENRDELNSRICIYDTFSILNKLASQFKDKNEVFYN